jgi:glycosyltransferase involved in cell wall biosynthesis
MNILFLLLDLPNYFSSSNLYLDLAVEFKNHGHNVFVLAPSKKKEETGRHIHNGINIILVKSLKQTGVKSFLLKGLAQILLPYQFMMAYQKYLTNNSFDLILMPTPPITLIKFVCFAKKRNTKAKFYLILRDIYPQGAADIGLVKSKFVYSFLRRLEIKTYEMADFIGCMSQGNIDYVFSKNSFLEKGKLFLLPNWQKNEFLSSSNDNEIKDKYDLEGKFIVLFGGTIGYAQRIENIIKLASYCEKYENVKIVIIGNGVKKKYLQKLIYESRLQNIILFDHMSRFDYLSFAKEADIGFITIDERFTVPTIPSKTVSYFSLSLPVLAVIDPHTDYPNLLKKSNAGLWSFGGNDIDLFNNFDRLYQNEKLRKEMGENGRRYFERHLTSLKAYENIINHITV